MDNTLNQNEPKELTLLEFFTYADKVMDVAFDRWETNKEIFSGIMYHARKFGKEDITFELMQQKAKERGVPELWEIPQKFEKPVDIMKFSPDYLPPLLRDYIRAVADYVQVDTEMCVLPLLSVLARCVQGKFNVCFPNTLHSEPLNLYTLTVASPGERKSGVFRTLTTPLFEYQKKENERLAPLIAEYRSKSKSLANTFESLTRGKNADPQKAQDIALQMESLKRVNRLTLNITDCTPESLTAELADNNETMGILDEECGIFGILAGLYSNGTANLDIFLKAYDGSPYVVTRRTKENIYLEHPVITLGLMAQPEPFANAMSKPEFVGRGLIHRFIFAFPESRQGDRKPYSVPIPDKLNEQYSSLVERLMKSGTFENPQILRFDKEATGILCDYFYSIEHRLKEGGNLAYMAEWANKLYAKCCRIAGILHLCTHSPEELIDGDTAMKSAGIAMWAENQAHKAFSNTAFDDEVIKNAKYVLKNLKDKKEEVYTKREILRLCQKLKVNEIDEVLETLDDMKCIRISEEHTKTKIKTIIKVNPLIFDE